MARCYASSERPVISARLLDAEQLEHGRRDVGEDAAVEQRRRRRRVTTNGTGLSECAVFGRAVGLEHLVGVAVVGGDDAARRPRRATASTTRPRHSSTVSTAFTAAGMTPGVADHVGVGEVDDPERRLVARASASTNASAASRALISGLWS